MQHKEMDEKLEKWRQALDKQRSAVIPRLEDKLAKTRAKALSLEEEICQLHEQIRRGRADQPAVSMAAR